MCARSGCGFPLTLERQSHLLGPDALSGWASAARQISLEEEKNETCRAVPGRAGQGARRYVDRGASTLNSVITSAPFKLTRSRYHKRLGEI